MQQCDWWHKLYDLSLLLNNTDSRRVWAMGVTFILWRWDKSHSLFKITSLDLASISLSTQHWFQITVSVLHYQIHSALLIETMPKSHLKIIFCSLITQCFFLFCHKVSIPTDRSLAVWLTNIKLCVYCTSLHCNLSDLDLCCTSYSCFMSASLSSILK